MNVRYETYFRSTQSTHGKSYSLSEEQHRMQIFSKNREEIANHNTRFVKGEVTYSMGLNQFSDLVRKFKSRWHEISSYV